MAASLKVQHISDDISNTGGTNTAFTAVGSLTSAIELANNNRMTHAGNADLTAGNLDSDDMAGGRVLTGTGTLTYYRESASDAANMRFETSLLEYVGPSAGNNEFIVRGRYAVALNGTTNSTTVDVTSAGISTAADCIPFITGIMNDATVDDADSGTALAYLESSTTLRVQKGSNGNNVTVYITLVEFTGSNWTVLHGDSGSVSADSGTITLRDGSDGTGTATNVSAWAEAVIFGQHIGDTGSSGTNDAIADNWPLFEDGANAQSVDWSFDANHDSGGTNRHFVHVLNHADMAVTRYSLANNAAGETTVNITSASLSSLDQAIVVGSSISSGTGAAYGRGWRNYYFNSTTQAAFWCHRSGNTMAHRMQIVDLSGITHTTTGISSINPTSFAMNNADVDINGANFEASQGTGKVYISDATTLAGSANEVDVSSAVNTWSDTLVNLNLSSLSASELSSLHTLGPGTRYVILVNNSSNEYASAAITLSRPPAFAMTLGAATPGSTTSRLTGMTGTFGGGRIEESVNPSATTTDVASNGYREDVWSLSITPEAFLGSDYEFRVLYGAEVSDTLTQTPTVTASSGSTTHQGATTLTGTGSITVVGNLTLAALSALSGTGSLVVTGEVTKDGAAALEGAGSIVADANVARDGQANISGTGSITASAEVTRYGAASLSSTGSLTTATAFVTYQATASLSANGQIAANPLRTSQGAANLSGIGSAAINPHVQRFGFSSDTGVGTLTADGYVDEPPSYASLSGAGSISASAIVGKEAATSLPGNGSIVADAARITFGTISGSADGTLISEATISKEGHVSLSSTGSSLSAAERTLFGYASLSSTGSLLAAQEVGPLYGSVSLMGVGAMTVDEDHKMIGKYDKFGSGA